MMTGKRRSFLRLFLLHMRTKRIRVWVIITKKCRGAGLRPGEMSGEGVIPMLSLRDVIDFAAMSEELASEIAETAQLPDLGAVFARSPHRVVEAVVPCGANDIDVE
jgi:hypothetical protein